MTSKLLYRRWHYSYPLNIKFRIFCIQYKPMNNYKIIYKQLTQHLCTKFQILHRFLLYHAISYDFKVLYYYTYVWFTVFQSGRDFNFGHCSTAESNVMYYNHRQGNFFSNWKQREKGFDFVLTIKQNYRQNSSIELL